VPHAPFETITGAKAATPQECIAICCAAPNCTEWIHTTSFGPDDLAGGDVAADGCAIGEPCCQLHACATDQQKGCHHNIHPRSSKITSGRTTPFKLQFAGVFGDDMILQRAPSSAAIYGMALPNQEVLVRVVASHSGQAVEMRDRASATGAWVVRLPAHDAGGNYTIHLSCPECPGAVEMATISRVSFGDVWLCSGREPSHHLPGSHLHSSISGQLGNRLLCCETDDAAAAAAAAAAAPCRVKHVASSAAHVWSEFHLEEHRSWRV
jgi:hypothetical protein